MNDHYTHIIKKSNQKCFPAVWWPTSCQNAKQKEKTHPMFITETGQITRVAINNLRKIKKQYDLPSLAKSN